MSLIDFCHIYNDVWSAINYFGPLTAIQIADKLRLRGRDAKNLDAQVKSAIKCHLKAKTIRRGSPKGLFVSITD